MSTLKALKEYLVGAGGYLLNDDNNGKTVMLSGAWGSGKTHFWQNEIEREQKKVKGKTRKVNKYSAKEYKEGLFSKLKKRKKACVYVSLYGKDNIEDIKSEVFTKVYSQIPTKGNKDKNIDTAVTWLGYGSKIASAVSVFGVKIDTTQATDKAKDYIDNEKLNKAQEAIRDGGVICFDDFERKSKKIDLNDLFGVLTQLSLDFNCKVVIILNSDVFEGEEANVFKTVKEKTVNKFFYFEPTIEELFNSIYESNEKYKKLDAYRAEILKAIEETEELNARIYIQVLDNCLEWIGKGYDKNTIRSLVFISVNFILNDLILTKPIRIKSGYSQFENIVYSEINYPDNRLCMASPARKISENNIKFEDMTGRKLGGKEYNQKTSLIEKIFEILSENKKRGHEFSETEQVAIRSWINKNKRKLDAIWKYGYQLYCMDTIDDSTYNKQANFVKSGILLKNHKESS